MEGTACRYFIQTEYCILHTSLELELTKVSILILVLSSFKYLIN